MINSSSDLVSRKTLDLRFQIQILILHFNASQPKPPSLRIHFSHFGSRTPQKIHSSAFFFRFFSGAFLLKKGTLGPEDSGLVFWLPSQPSDSPDPDIHGARETWRFTGGGQLNWRLQWYKKWQNTKQNHPSTSDSWDWEDSQTKKAPKLQRHRVGWDHCKFDKKMWMHVDKHPTEETWIWKQCYSMRRGKRTQRRGTCKNLIQHL